MQYTEKINKLLVRRFLEQELTAEEDAHLQEWVNASDINRGFYEEITTERPEVMAEVRAMKNVDIAAAWEKMEALGWERARMVRYVRMRRRVRYIVAAAAVLLFLAIGFYIWRQPHKLPKELSGIVKDAKQDAQPTTQQAYLTLDNGEKIILDSLRNGLLATQGSTEVVRDKDGVLRYNGKGNNQPLIYNTITVPKGGDVVYLQLSDKSKVWLNAASSIRYPVAFTGDERKVEITGEAYFEVARSDNKKFTVSKGDMNIVVLGTRFNVNTYDNEESSEVTLLEGSVKVQSANGERTIKPGQQAVLNNVKIDVINEVDVGAVMAWKEGKFVFNNTNIQLIMRQMERWYDLEKTEFKSNSVKQLAFNGAISRYNNASKVLELLEEAGSLHFTIHGKKVILSQ